MSRKGVGLRAGYTERSIRNVREERARKGRTKSPHREARKVSTNPTLGQPHMVQGEKTMRSLRPPLSAASPDFGRFRKAVFTYPAFAEFFGTCYRFDSAAGDTSYLFYPGGHEVYFSRQRLSSENKSPVQTHLLIREPGLLEFPFFLVNIGNTLLICHGNSRPFSCEIFEALDCRRFTSKMHALLSLSIIGRDSLAFS